MLSEEEIIMAIAETEANRAAIRERKDKPLVWLTPMNGIDLDQCVRVANKADPKRGLKWVSVFQRVAKQLGYQTADQLHPLRVAPVYGPYNLQQTLGRVEAPAYDPWPHDHTGYADGLLTTDRLPSSWHSDPSGWHRHRCVRCDAVWSHAQPEEMVLDGDHEKRHTCPYCGYHREYRPGWCNPIIKDCTYYVYTGPRPPGPGHVQRSSF